MNVMHGRAYLARTSNQVEASLEIDASTATLKDAAGVTLTMCPAQDLQVDAPLGRADRRITLPDGTLFETPDHQAVAALTGQRSSDILHSAERFGPRLIYVTVAAILGVLAVWRFALPVLVWAAVALTPQPLRDAMDVGTLQAFDRTMASPTTLDQARQSEVQAIFENLISNLDTPSPDDFRLHFRSVPHIGPNAFALPGGTIVITDALVQRFPDEDVIAAVLGHELGHVVEDHGLTQLYRSLGIFVLISLIAGETGPILEDVILEGGVILSLQYSRKHEAAADTFGLTLTERAGYDPAGLIAFFEALPDSKVEDTSWEATHPASGARIKAIREFLSRP